MWRIKFATVEAVSRLPVLTDLKDKAFGHMAIQLRAYGPDGEVSTSGPRLLGHVPRMVRVVVPRSTDWFKSNYDGTYLALDGICNTGSAGRNLGFTYVMRAVIELSRDWAEEKCPALPGQTVYDDPDSQPVQVLSTKVRR